MSLTIFYKYKGQNERMFTSCGNEVLVGRAKDLPVHLELSPDLKVSRPHARLFYELGTWWVEDLNSQHGTFLGGERVDEPTELSPGDQLRVGDTVLRVEFEKSDATPGEGSLESFHVHETRLAPVVPEDRRLNILTRVSTIAATSINGQAMLEGFLREISDAFPAAQRKTIMLVEDGELVPRVYWPPDRSYISFTLARQAITKKQALIWKQQPVSGGGHMAPSMLDAVEALYAPILFNGRAVGVIHADTTKGVGAFGTGDLELLSVIANTMGAALKATSGLGKIPSVFVSYSHEERAFAARLTSDLRRHGVKVYIDERLQAGEGWRKQLAVAIENTDAFILIMSPASVVSEYVEWELDTAQAMGKRIFPLMYRQSDVPLTILSLQYIDIGRDYDKGLSELAERLHEFRNPVAGQPQSRAQGVSRADAGHSPDSYEQAWEGIAPPADKRRVSAATRFVLHLSDLHFGTEDDAVNWHSQLAEDLHHELGCTRLDAIIISGDITNRADEKEFKAARLLLDSVCKEFGLDVRQVALVPGNHDLSWRAAKKAYTCFWRDDRQQHDLREGTYIEDNEIIAIRDEEEYKQRFAGFSAFYKELKGNPYALDYEDQYTLDYFPELNLLVLGLNSAWELDHRYTSRASIHPLAVSNALEAIRQRPEYASCLKLAVWHHPLHSEAEDRIKVADFMDRLAVGNFRIALHGHIHKAESSAYIYDYSRRGRKLDVIAAGTFGAPVKEWVPGYPLQYNLLKLGGGRLTVETRRREKLNGAWQPDARWTQGAGRDPLPRYVIRL